MYANCHYLRGVCTLHIHSCTGSSKTTRLWTCKESWTEPAAHGLARLQAKLWPKWRKPRFRIVQHFTFLFSVKSLVSVNIGEGLGKCSCLFLNLNAFIFKWMFVYSRSILHPFFIYCTSQVIVHRKQLHWLHIAHIQQIHTAFCLFFPPASINSLKSIQFSLEHIIYFLPSE